MPAPSEIHRIAIQQYIDQVVQHVSPIQALAVIGSVAAGTARPDSDIDLVAFLEPFDQYALPAEAIWRAEDNSYHSIFRPIDGIQFDAFRVDLAVWREPQFAWPEGRRAELADAWLAFDRNGSVGALIAERTAYPESLRIARLDEALTWLDQHLGEESPEAIWERRGPFVAHDRLTAAYSYLVQGLFALNRRWQPWRNREADALLRLAWLPQKFAERALPAIAASGLDRAGYDTRVLALRSLQADLMAQCCHEGLYEEDPIGEAFVRNHAEPGRSWNMAEWQAEHRRRYADA